MARMVVTKVLAGHRGRIVVMGANQANGFVRMLLLRLLL
jgi:hypothetical protein